MADPRTPCIIGVAQLTWRDGDSPEPLSLWEEVSRRAAADTGAGAGRVLDAVQSLDVLYCQSWPYDSPAGRLAERLGMAPARQSYSGIGGTTPHLLLTGAAAAVARGEVDAALVVGGEALDTVRKAKRDGRRFEWSHRDPERKPFPFEAPFHPSEVAHSVFQAWLTFAVFDIARRAHLGVEPAEHRRGIGELLAPMSEVAAGNPHAWFRLARRGPELMEPTADNRMVGYPYTKTSVAVMDVDMAGALIVASEEKADALGVPREQRVYLRGGAYAEDPVYVAEHDPMWCSPAMKAASSAALEAAGTDLDGIAHLDLYSCFASSLTFACDALGLRTDDGRGLTVTGGLPFAGGPGSGYLLHSTSALVERLRADPGSLGLVSGVGMHMTKHSFGIWSTEPPTTDGLARLSAGDRTGRAGAGTTASAAPGPAAVPITEAWSGPATVAAYSIVHDRSGAAEWGLAVCDLPDGTRAYGRVEDADLMAEAEATEWVGAAVQLVAGEDGVNRVQRGQ